jgi:polyphosphate kinase 2
MPKTKKEKKEITRAKIVAKLAARGNEKALAKLSTGKNKNGDKPQDHALPDKKLKKKVYEKELARLQVELVKLQEYVRVKGLKVAILFEGRDAAGKGGVIKRITQRLNPRTARVVALGTPTEREKTQWYFQRYVAELPAAGEIVLFDRSWYNRAGVERVMGFCTEKEYMEFMRSAPEFEDMLVRSGIILLKYWFSVSDDEQESRFQKRIADPTKRWKLSPMDLESRARWVDYSRAKDAMLAATDLKVAPWWIVPADNKNRARLNCMAHILGQFTYKDYTPKKLKLPPRQVDPTYVRPPIKGQNFVPEAY